MISLPPTLPCRAPQLFAQVKQRTGGVGWDRLGEITALGSATISGLHGSGRQASDLRGGRYAERFTIAVMGTTAEVNDGRTLWSQDISGGVHPLNAPFSIQRRTTESFVRRYGYLSPGTSARFTCLKNTSEQGRTVERVSVRPIGGIEAILSIDAQTHLLPHFVI